MAVLAELPRRRVPGRVLGLLCATLCAGGTQGSRVPARAQPSLCVQGSARGGLPPAQQASRAAAQSPALLRRQMLLQLPASALALCAAAVLPRVASAAASSVVRDEAGFRYYDIRPGEGASPKWGQLLTINYAGYTLQEDGSLRCFDSSFAREDPYLLKHGNGQQVKGLELALHGMRIGGRRRVILPQETLGFTVGALGPLPVRRAERERLQDEINKTEQAGRNVDLIFDVELLTAMDDVIDRGIYEDVTISVAQQEAGIPLENIMREAAATEAREGAQ
ncbi:hypothetical protein T492DRAFT_1032858 [Pavlovales sp. CCMP2436]|nr:hypothetical protein T492DRAFT_1032858 [Pavlovales sp. CCMP2436]|mmetsp:Transcript_12705/g.32187  ORF Transcript_12705/g.32187 Transcript_12705/m.32187 type:complete len:279 (-) Transcript_12705:337-1173(-)